MHLSDAQSLAKSLMNDHQLTASGWRFKFDNAKLRCGVCNYRTKTIGLSRHYVSLNPIEPVRDTILHEIAHALTPGAGHGPVWRAMCQRIGAKPRACKLATEIAIPNHSWETRCTKCQKTTKRTYRRRADRTLTGRLSRCCRAPVVQLAIKF
jgi:predicted SprT family Zn-dependent metalloprotease